MGGRTFDQAVELLKLTKDQDPDRKVLSRLLNSGLYADLINACRVRRPIDRDAVRRAYCLPPLGGIDTAVDYGRDLRDLAAEGNYEAIGGEFLHGTRERYVEGIKAKRIPAETRQRTHLVHFELVLFDDAACRRLDINLTRQSDLDEKLSRNMLRRATPIEILTFGKDDYISTRFPVFTCFATKEENYLDLIILHPYNPGRSLFQWKWNSSRGVWSPAFLLAAKI